MGLPVFKVTGSIILIFGGINMRHSRGYRVRKVKVSRGGYRL